jgi:hypothetical protein
MNKNPYQKGDRQVWVSLWRKRRLDLYVVYSSFKKLRNTVCKMPPLR